MKDISIFIKTYKKDFNSFERLIKSINKYNLDNIPVVISVNDRHFNFFKKRLNLEKYILIKDSDIFKTTIVDGWRYQQVIKMNFFRLYFSKFYVCIDSDSIFIRNFTKKDFLKDGIPLLIKHKSELFQEELSKLGFNVEDLFFKKSLLAVKKTMNSKDVEIFDYGPSPYVWECSVWESFFEDYLKNTTIENYFAKLDSLFAPSENAIYGEYMNMYSTSKYIPSSELFKVYHYKEQFDLEKNKKTKYLSNKYKDKYLGIIIQSNFFKENFLKKKCNNFIKLYFKIKC